MKVALLKGGSRYALFEYFIHDLAQAFAVCGHQPYVIDLAEVPEHAQFRARLKSLAPLDLAFSFNIRGEYRDDGGRSVSDLIAAPHVIHYVDHPLRHLPRVKASPREAVVLTVDESHVRTLNTLFGPNRFAYVGFCPHGGLGEPRPLPPTLSAYLDERPIGVFFSGTFAIPEAPYWTGLPPFFQKIFADAADLAMSQEYVPALDVLDIALRANGISVDGTGFVKDARDGLHILREMSWMVHEWVRAQRRKRFLETAERVGLKLTAFGEGYDGRFSNIDWRGTISFEDCVEHMALSRLVVNVNANFGEGSHERPMTAMLAGAAAASDTSAFYRREFDDSEIALFRWANLEDDLDRLRVLSENPKKLYEMAQAGQKKAMAQHRWQHRIDTILNAASHWYGQQASPHMAQVS